MHEIETVEIVIGKNTKNVNKTRNTYTKTKCQSS